MHDAVINASCTIGKNCIINTKATKEHDVSISDFCHISTAAAINGACSIGESTFVGSNSVTKESIVIEKNCIIGAGISVKQNVKSGTVYVG
jgi:carbonic anhydrase/acetyltransferase-like protein (isoleucine patch superfamily)